METFHEIDWINEIYIFFSTVFIVIKWPFKGFVIWLWTFDDLQESESTNKNGWICNVVSYGDLFQGSLYNFFF